MLKSNWYNLQFLKWRSLKPGWSQELLNSVLTTVCIALCIPVKHAESFHVPQLAPPNNADLLRVCLMKGENGLVLV